MTSRSPLRRRLGATARKRGYTRTEMRWYVWRAMHDLGLGDGDG